MSANATGTPTSLGIPTFNVNQDILKGQGVNEMMAAIDPLIAGRMFAPTSPTNNQVVKWSTAGGAWIADFVAPGELKQAGATTGQVLTWNGSAWAAAPSLPTGASGGMFLQWNGTAWVASLAQAASVQLSGTKTNSTTGSMSVMATLGAFTPPSSAAVCLEVSFGCTANAAIDGIFAFGEGGVAVSNVSYFEMPTTGSGNNRSIYLRHLLNPTNASHTYQVLWQPSAAGMLTADFSNFSTGWFTARYL